MSTAGVIQIHIYSCKYKLYWRNLWFKM